MRRIIVPLAVVFVSLLVLLVGAVKYLAFSTRPRIGVGISAGSLIDRLIKVGGTLSAPALELDTRKAVISGGTAVATSGLSLLAKSVSNRFLGNDELCGEARRILAERDEGSGPE